jgi:hypothetical protein
MNPMDSGQVIFPHVRMQENITVRTVPTNVKATEQAPWFERALNAMDIARRELPVQNMKAIMKSMPTSSRPIGPQMTPAMSTIAVMLLVKIRSEHGPQRITVAFWMSVTEISRNDRCV